MLKEAYESARLKFKSWSNWRKERKAEKQAAKQAAMVQDPHGHSRFWLLSVPAIATVCAAVTEWYWAVLFCIEATGQIGMDWSTSLGSDTPAQGAWHFLFDIQSMWVLIGLILATMPIVMLSMIWLPVQFAMRGAGMWRRGTLIVVGVLANILVIVSGTVVMNYNRQDQVREAVVTEQSAQQGRAAIDARLAFEQEQLRLALNNSNPYLNQAANVGAAEWERSYVAQARATNDPRLPMLERALGAARAADQRRANIERLTIERAQAAPAAATAANVEDNVGRELNTFAQYVEVWRPPFVALICTLIGIFGAWWVLAMLERLNPRDVLRSGWADESHRIPDMRDEEAIVPQPMEPHREVATDAETGEELVKVKPREYWRRRGARKGKATKVEVQPEPQPDEQGVQYDGGGRMGSVAGAVEAAVGTHPKQQDEGDAGDSEQAARVEFQEDRNDPDGESHKSEAAEQFSQEQGGISGATTVEQNLSSELPDLTDDELLAFSEEPEQPQSASESGGVQGEQEEPDHSAIEEVAPNLPEPIEHHEPRTEPETDERRLIAAE